jgi:hypothetical protein
MKLDINIMTNEIWKQIDGFSRYEVSNLGRLRSTNYKNSGLTKILKPANCEGYMRTMIQSDDGKYKTIRIHRLVMLAFIGSSDLEVNHIDGDTTNNTLDNLEYVTRSGNMLHAYRTGLQKPLTGSSNGRSILTEDQVLEIRKYVDSVKASGVRYWNRKELADKYGISESYIKEIVINRTTRRKSWSHI